MKIHEVVIISSGGISIQWWYFIYDHLQDFLMCRSYLQWWHFYPPPGAGPGAEAAA